MILKAFDLFDCALEWIDHQFTEWDEESSLYERLSSIACKDSADLLLGHQVLVNEEPGQLPGVE